MRKIYLLVYKVLFKNFVNSDTIILGNIYKKIRGNLFNHYTGNKSKNINIQKGSRFAQNVILGENSGLGENSLVSGPVEIGNDVMMGPDVIIYTTNHRFDRVDLPMNRQGFSDHKKVVIEDDVWIGARVIILPGVRVGRGSILGAGTVISKDVEPYSIMVGNPSRKVKSRGVNSDV